ncbi:hypothetical protein Ancab_023016 [Ancistrocladus abbreviatus]
MPSQASLSFNPPTFSPLPAESYHPMLQESISHFLAQLQAGTSDFTHFESIFFRLIQTIPSPPIEIIWFYSAVNFHTQKNLAADHDQLTHVLALKELFQLLVSCSALCGTLKRVAVLAPLMFQLYSLVVELKGGVGLSLDKNVSGEIDCLLEGIVSFVSICCFEGRDSHDDSLALSPCFVGLVKVWTFGRCERDFEFGDALKMFSPMLTDEVRAGVSVDCRVGYLAGVVLCQSFFLKLCLRFGSMGSRKELEDEVRSLATNMVTGFQSCCFFDSLLKMLLEPILPVTSLVGCDNEVLLREVLFDAVIMVDYPFFNPESGIQKCGSHLKNLAIKRLFVAENAVQFVRQKGDHNKAIYYTKALSDSLINSQLMSWVGMGESTARSIISSPAVILEWLVSLKSQASKDFDPEISDLFQKLKHYKSRVNYGLPLLENINGGWNEKEDINGDHEMFGSRDTCLGVVCSSNFGIIDGGRKRKEGMKEDERLQVKMLKYQCHDKSIKILPRRNDDVLAGKEVENSVADEDMEIMVQ